MAHLAPFVDVSRQKIRAEVFEDVNCDCGAKLSEEELNHIVEKRVRREVKRGVQTIQYQINTLLTTNGQTPFVTVFMYLDEVPEGQTRDDLALIIEETLLQRIEGVKNEKGIWITPAFPKLIYVLDEDNIQPGSKYYYEHIGFATLLDALMTGNIVQFLCDISPYPENRCLWLGIAYMLFGFLFIALGMYVYMKAEQGCGPKDGLLIAIGKRLSKIPIGILEILLWAVVTLFGWLLGGAVGIGTVISTFGAGAVMHLFYTVIHFEPRKLKHKSLTETVKLLSGK